MKATFSEFSFSYALTQEIVDGSRPFLHAAPYLPSLQEEGGSEGSYDVRLNVRGQFLFLQFKLSDYMKRRSAKQWHHFGSPYYRFALRPGRHSDQHDLMLDLERRYELVAYAAPAFYLIEDLNRTFLDHNVIDHTFFVRPSNIGSFTDDDEQHMSFDIGRRRAVTSSEPRSIEDFSFGGTFLDEVVARARNRELQVINDEAFASLSNELKVMLSRRFDVSTYVANRLETLPPVQRAVHISRTYFDSEILIVRTDRDSIHSS